MKIAIKLLLSAFIMFCSSVLSFGVENGQEEAWLKITNCNVAFAEVYLNGKHVATLDGDGNLPDELLPISKGKYLLSIRKQGYVPYEEEIEIDEESLGLVHSPSRSVVLKPIQQRPGLSLPAPVKANTGKINVRINPPLKGVRIWIDGAYKGKTDEVGNLLVEDLGIGSHRIEARSPGFRKTSEVVEIDEAGLAFPAELNLIAHDGLSGLLLAVLFASLVVLSVVAIFAVSRSRRVTKRSYKPIFDRYELLSLIGRGGMSTIYKARDQVTRQLVALKIMDQGYLTDLDLVNKFMREGRAISEINKEAPAAPVVRVFRFGRENDRPAGRPFIAMEILEGPDLLKLLRLKKKFSELYVVSVGRQVAEALRPAHERGIYHRDVTPDNIIVIRDNPNNPVVRLIDFGVARHEYTSIGTLDGSIAGKPAYMSPEQCRGERVDGRSDIYSLGIILYALIMGNPPFVSNNPLEVMKHHERTPVAPITVSIADTLKNIIYKMLEKDREKRYQNVVSLLLDLNRAVLAL